VVESRQIPAIIKLFSNDSLLPFLIPVVYNVCVDYGASPQAANRMWQGPDEADTATEPAQLEASKASLSSVLVEIIGGPRLNSCRHFLNIICKILKMLISQGMFICIAPVNHSQSS